MTYEWAVVGGGPAGIAAVGKLLDANVSPQAILWVDPAFRVGDFGTLWRNVPSNTRVGLFLDFLNNCKAFRFSEVARNFQLSQLEPKDNCYLRAMADPLQWISNHLMETVVARKSTVHRIQVSGGGWKLGLGDSIEHAKQVILATGAEAKSLAYVTPQIQLHDAMDADRIREHLAPNDTVAVFGSSHSAILAIRNLVEHNAKRIVNFYRSPLRYAVHMDDWILFDDTGLKGSTAQWAREKIGGELPENLERVYANAENISAYLPQCNKAVYAVGFEARRTPAIQDIGHAGYLEQCGIMAPGLFGFGIAYPEAKVNPIGILEYRVGLWKFMDYLNRVLPIWMRYT